MRRSAVPTVALVAAAALVALLIYGVASKGTNRTLDDALRNGKAAVAPGASIQLPKLDGTGTSSLADYRGKVLVLNFWASWCTPCAAEAPILKRAQASMAADGSGTVLGATNDDAPGASRAFMREHGLTFPNVRDLGTKLWHEFGSTGVPETFVIDARGRVVAIDRGQLDEQFLTQAIAKAKGTPA